MAAFLLRYMQSTVHKTSIKTSIINVRGSNLEDTFIKEVIHTNHYIRILIETTLSIQTYSDCGKQIKHIQDYRYQKIKEPSFQMKHTCLILKEMLCAQIR